MAFWFKSKDSVCQAVPRLLSLVLMGAYFFSSYQCIPINTEIVDTTPWWCQPCQKEHKTRHSRGITESVLKDTFNIVLVDYGNYISNYVKQLGTKLQIGNMSKKQLKNNTWLPRKKFFRMLKKNDEKILPKLLHNIQIYAVTIDRLSKMEIRSQDASFNVVERNKVLQQVKANINALRCQTEHEIAEKRMTKLEDVPANFANKHIPEAVDHLTEGLLRDYSILTDYHIFLDKCFKKIFGKGKKNSKRNKNKGDTLNKKRTPKNKLKNKNKVSES